MVCKMSEMMGEAQRWMPVFKVRPVLLLSWNTADTAAAWAPLEEAQTIAEDDSTVGQLAPGWPVPLQTGRSFFPAVAPTPHVPSPTPCLSALVLVWDGKNGPVGLHSKFPLHRGPFPSPEGLSHQQGIS